MTADMRVCTGVNRIRQWCVAEIRKSGGRIYSERYLTLCLPISSASRVRDRHVIA